MKLLELFMPDRDRVIDAEPPEPPPFDRNGDGNGPKSGKYWVKADSVVAITTAQPRDTLVKPESLQIIQHPEQFGLTTADLTAFFSQWTDSAKDYKAYLAGDVAWLGRLSSLMMDFMFAQGWSLVLLNPEPDSNDEMYIACAKTWAKRSVEAVASHFALMQLDDVILSLVGDGYLPYYHKRIETITFRREDAPGFGGILQAIMNWLSHGEIPEGNYIYFLAPDVNGRMSRLLEPNHGKFPVGNGKYRTGYGLIYFYDMPKPKPGMKVYRALYSVLHHQMHLETFDLGKRGVFFSTLYFAIQKHALQEWDGRNWVKL